MNINPEAIERIKAAPALEGVHELIRRRWSPRAFSGRAVTPEQLRVLLDAAHWSASSYNEQPWRFIVTAKSNPEAYDKMLSVLVERNQQWAKSAPVLMLTVAKTAFSHSGQPNRFAIHDTGMALATLMIQATFMGLHVHAMAGYDRDRARSIFGIPPDYEPAAAVAIGYFDDAEALPPELREAEVAPRQRKPLSELVFGEEWGEAAII
jgi:nitroreductase